MMITHTCRIIGGKLAHGYDVSHSLKLACALQRIKLNICKHGCIMQLEATMYQGHVTESEKHLSADNSSHNNSSFGSQLEAK